MAKITIAAIGSRGNVQPFVALGVGLRRAGHTVRVVASDEFADFVADYGLEFWPLGVRLLEIMAGGGADRALEAGRDASRAINEMMRLLWPLLDTMQASIWAASQGADALIASVFAIPGGQAIAEKLGIPFFPAILYPILQTTRELPNWLLPFRVRLGGHVNALTHRLVHQTWWQSMRGWVNGWRAEVGLWPFRWDEYPFHALLGQPIPYLYGFSPIVIPRPPDWEPHAHVTGYWFLPPPEGWEPPAELEDFLAAGPPPVYLGFGSVSFYRAEETVRLFKEALAKAGLRGVVSLGPETAQFFPANNETIFPLPACPHAWLFPRMAAVVHHGGAGTTAAGLRAGVPSVLVPFAADQPHWADRVQALGVGPAPLPRQRLSAATLAYALRVAVSHAPMRQRAAAVGAVIRAEDGISTAVEIIEYIVTQYTRQTSST